MDFKNLFVDFENPYRKISILEKEKYFSIINNNPLFQAIMWYFNKHDSSGSVYHSYTQMFDKFVFENKNILYDKTTSYSNDLIKNCIIEYIISISDEIPGSCVDRVIILFFELGATKLRRF